MNIFYAPPSQINNGFIELLDQEAAHASRVLRAREGDSLTVVDGKGGKYQGVVRRITKESVQVEIERKQHLPAARPAVIVGMGIIKKRDRLEFAVEKAVELGADKIYLFRSERTVKENVRMDRLESIAVSAMKQSLRTRLPEILVFPSLESMMDSVTDASYLVAHEIADPDSHKITSPEIGGERLFLLVGPEGGFSQAEIEKLKQRDARLVSLGTNRLRTETAVVVFLSQFI